MRLRECYDEREKGKPTREYVSVTLRTNRKGELCKVAFESNPNEDLSQFKMRIMTILLDNSVKRIDKEEYEGILEVSKDKNLVMQGKPLSLRQLSKVLGDFINK